jgi:hypothetical protein
MKIYKYNGKKHPEITRKSYRDYTHVVLLYAGGKLIDKSFCGREDLVPNRLSNMKSWHLRPLKEQGYSFDDIKFVIDELEKK